VTFDEALKALGIVENGDEPVTQGEVRKAYVAGIKRHRPEKDPEGFQRIREAYERALEGLAKPGEGLAVVSEVHASEPVAPLSAEQLRSAAAIEAIYQTLDRAKDDDARILLLTRAIKEHPGEPSLRWNLIDLLYAIGKPGAAERELLEGVRLSLPGFLETLAMENPDTITDAQFIALDQGPSRLAVARVHIAKKRPREALVAIDSLLERAAREHRPLQRSFFFELAVFAMERGEHDVAARAMALTQERTELFSRTEHASPLEVIARDMLAIARSVPHAFLKLFARGVRRRSPHSVFDAVLELRDEKPEESARVMITLETRAPSLFSMYGGLLGDARTRTQAQRTRPISIPPPEPERVAPQPRITPASPIVIVPADARPKSRPEPQVREKPRVGAMPVIVPTAIDEDPPRNWHWVWIVIAVLSIGVRFCIRSRFRDEPEIPAATAPPTQPSQASRRVPHTASVQPMTLREVQAAVTLICEESDVLCSRVRSIRNMLAAGRCAEGEWSSITVSDYEGRVHEALARLHVTTTVECEARR
jgi:hypothetical protein